MKIKNLIPAAFVAMAAAFAPGWAEAHSGNTEGDIYSIDILGPGDHPRYFGKKPSTDDPASIGDIVIIRVRMVNPDFPNGEQWLFQSTTDPGASIDTSWLSPKLGIKIGDSIGQMEYVDTEAVTSPADTFTDIFFGYEVQAGDLALPALLQNVGGFFQIYNDLYWKLKSTYTDPSTGVRSTVTANWKYHSDEEWVPEEPDPAHPGQRTPTGAALNMYMSTISFDNNFFRRADESDPTDEGVWRQIPQGTVTASPIDPQLTVAKGATAVKSTTLYVWSEREGTIIPYATKDTPAERVKLLDKEGNETGETRYVIAVTVPANGKSAPFLLKGIEIGTTHVCLGSTKNLVYNDIGEVVTNWTTQVVSIVEPPPPHVKLEVLNREGVQTGMAQCTTNYQDYVAMFRVSLVGAVPDHQVTVTVTPDAAVLPVSGTARIGVSELGEKEEDKAQMPWFDPPKSGLKRPITVTFEAGQTERMLYVYALEGTDDLANKVTYTPSTTDATFKQGTPESGSLTILKATPVALSPNEREIIDNVMAGDEFQLNVYVDDCFNGKRRAGWVFWYRSSAVGQSKTWQKIEGTGDGLQPDPDSGEITVKITPTIVGDNQLFEYYLEVPTEHKSPTDPTPGTRTTQKMKTYINVKDGMQAEAYFDGDVGPFAENTTGVKVYCKVSQPSSTHEPMYAFLNPLNDVASNCVSSAAMTTAPADTSCGVTIERGQVDSKTSGDYADLTLLDGADPSSRARFEVLICETQKYDKDKVLNSYARGQLSFNISNIVAKVASVSAIGCEPVKSSGGTMKGDMAVNVKKTFTVKLQNDSECLADLDATNKPFATRWTFNNGTPVIVYGDPSTNSVTWAPNTPGLIRVSVCFQDKDMRAKKADYWSEEFEFYVNVIAAPAITIEPTYETDQYAEDKSGPLNASYKVLLNIPPSFTNDAQKLNVNIYATKLGGTDLVDRRYLELSVTNLVFKSGQSEGSFFLKTIDGTLESANGYDLHAEVNVETSDTDTESKTWSSASRTVYIINNDPEITSPSPQYDDKGNSVPQTTEVGTALSLEYNVRDIQADLTNGLTVTWTTSEGVKQVFTNATGRFDFKFTSSGSKYARMEVKDKDGGHAEIMINYTINAAKKLITVAAGPGGVGTTLSTRYANAEGVGKGHTFAHNVAFSGASLFQISWNCSVLKSVDVSAWGYKSGAVDDGNLDSSKPFEFDVPLTAFGGNDTTDGKTAITNCYEYTDSRDSFLYALLGHTVAEGGLESSVMVISPELDSPIKRPVPLPEADAQGGGNNGGSESVSYPDTICEAIFAKEYLWSDNLGDINQDGIPDHFALQYHFDVYDEATNELIGDDLKMIVDEESGDNLDEDYLPATAGTSYSVLIPGLKETWIVTGGRFKAKMEIRGYHDGLNSAYERADRVYAARGEDGKLCYPTNATISRVEYEAWLDFAAAHGLDPTNTVSFEAWSPEHPSNPMKEDTNGNGFPDGYEYYFWYQAHVGQGEGVEHRYMTGRRYDPKNPGAGKLITSKEIEDRVSSGGAGDWTDTDNDGLPDLIEMEIGTNPFDFDTDGDGLPDGWEIIVAGTSPYTAFTTPGISDAMRNFDGDAMAFNTPELERTLTTPQNYHVEDPYVFALEDADGDSDGVQWYTTKFKPAITNSETVVSGALIRVDLGSVTNFYMTTAKGYRLTEDNVLMTELSKSETWQVEPTEALTNTLPSIADATYKYVRLAPTTLRAGTRFLEPPTKNPDEFTAFGFLALVESVSETDCNAAWFYGSSAVSTMTTGQDTANMGGFGMLALGRYQSASAGVPLTALPRKYSGLAYLHYLVYQEWGFDPRTAWNANTPLAPRWAKKKTTGEGESATSETYDNVSSGSWAGASNRTREFTTYDEFLLYSFWINNGCETKSFATRYDDVLALVNEWLAQTTNPQGPNEPDLDTDGEEAGEDGAIPYHGRNSDQGADTDMDGVPDGWELYVMTGPKYNLMGMKLCYVFAGPNGSAPNANAALFPFVSGDSSFGHMSPLVAEAASTKTDNKLVSGDEDDLSELQEFAGTDSCAYYSEAAEGATPFSTTIVRPVEHAQWLNKFFPTDPWASDTDHDGVTDIGEFEGGRAMVKSHSFVYGTPADNGSQCIVGGGLNPCSVDTDLDGLPDGWESQYPGQEIYSEGYAAAHNLIDLEGKLIIDYAKDAEGNAIGNPLQGLVDGMDGTVPDAFNTPYKNYSTADGDSTYSASKIISINGARQVVDRDYDHDGLSNWQEYLTGAMRCWRYDDPFSPWGYVPTEDWFDVNGETNEFNLVKAMAATGSDTEGEFWYKTLVDKSSPYYAPRLQTGTGAMSQYFTWLDPRKYGFDPAYSDTGSYYIFFSRIGDNNLAEWWGGKDGLNIETDDPKEPCRYISTSPVEADSDHDGMDDYYELFHGMNPLLGEAGVTYESDGPCDLVFDAWKDTGTNKAFHDAEDNYWTRDPETLLGKTPRCKIAENMYDFELFPWLNGAANADPDGDDIRNQQEAVMPMVAPSTIWYHTDPTPLWMTDSSYTNSLVTRFFRVAITPVPLSLGGESFEYEGQTYYFCELTGGYFIDPMEGPKLKPYTPDQWSLTGSAAKKNWMFSFEENEGFDSDHDVIGDYEELQGKFTSATDPKDFDAPHRRQAMYFPGQNAALQSMPYESEKHPVGHTGYPDDMSFVQYTVECWVYPERDTDQTILERAIWSTFSNPGDQEYLRRNFQIAIKQGRWYTMFDPNGTLSNKQVSVISSGAVQLNTWTHLAATYDTEKLTLYVNGVPEPSQPANLTPEYGSSAVTVYPGDPQSTKAELNNAKGNMYWFDHEYQYIALLMGASFKGVGDIGVYPNHLNVMNGKGWGYYKNFFQGYVDEVRIWDGARTEEEIRDNMKVRFTAETAKANRADFYDQWAAGNRRYAKDQSGKDYHPIPELRYHFSFDSIPGSASPAMAAKTPFGFSDTAHKAFLSRPEDYEIPWWSKVLAGYTGTVYGNSAWIQWIPNTVTHLPRFDATTLDSMYWSEDFAGNEQGSYKFARSAEPVSMWTQMTRNKVSKDDDFYSTERRYWQVYTMGTNNVSNLTKLFEFTGRHLNQMGDDLLPLGGAYVKYTDVMWDEQGSSSNWEISGNDADGDGLPDWWTDYAEQNYRMDDMDPSAHITWDTIVNYHGRLMTAWEAYLLDLAKGYYVDENGEIVTDPELAEKRKQTADEDGDGMADWWEDRHGLQTWSKADAEADPDNDGLNNYSEYLVSQGEAPYGFTNLNPKAARSFVGQQASDYFLPVPDEFADEKHISKGEYLGEVFTDHDFMEDWWENKHSLSYANSRIYDPWDDTDGDGWSNFSECRAFMWGGSFSADLIDRYLDGDDHINCYPQPAVGVRFTYDIDQLNDTVGKGLVVRTSTVGKRTDATFIVPGSAGGMAATKHFVGGYYEDTTLHGFLNPGSIVPVGVVVRKATLSSAENLTWNYLWYESISGRVLRYNDPRDWYGSGTFEEYRSELRKYPHAELEEGNVTWVPVGMVTADAEAHYGRIMDGTTEIGTIDFRTGEYTLDMAKLKMAEAASLDGCVFSFEYQYRIGMNWPQTLWLSEATKGRVKEGLNTIEAFIDLNNSGEYDIGEPYGCAKNVQVGWHKVPEITIELTDHSTQFKRTLLAGDQGSGDSGDSGDSDGTKPAEEVSVQFWRTAINGRAAESPLLVRTFVPEDRSYITEADIISDRMPELDWGWLPRNAVEVQYAVIQSMELEDGSVSNVILSTFTKAFNPSNRPAVSVVSPIANDPVYSDAPTFRFTMENTASAFAIQVGCEDSSGKTNVIYDSGVQLRGGRSPYEVGKSAYSFTAPIYANTSITTNGAPVLLDGSNYFWRVASFNAKFTTAQDADYSAWTPFQMDVANVNRYPRLATGYGSVAAAVRYFGPARTNDLTNLIVVEAFENADFTGQAMAQTRVGSTNDLDNANLRSDTLAVTNACLIGVLPGTVYLRAYIDLNNNGKWDKFEPWGYANNVGRYGEAFSHAPIYNPLGIEVSGGIGDVVKPNVAAIFIEDTDCDKNEIPDCLQTWDDSIGDPDSDNDGLSDYEEENIYGSNPYDAYSIWLRNRGDDSAKYTDGEAIKFNLLDGNIGTDSDFDGLTNWQELQACRKDATLGLKVDDPTSDGLTNDYFRVFKSGVEYTGELNGAEWIEFAARDFFGMNNLSRAGTRDLLNEGWDMWSISRYILNGGQIVQWNAIGEGGATTNANELSYEPLPELKVTLLYRGGGSKDVRFAAYQGPLMDLENQFPATEWASAVGFDNGVGKLTLTISNRVEETGTLKQGPARIVAYIDNDGDEKFSCADSFGMAETEIGWANQELEIRMGDPCAALPAFEFGNGSNFVSQVKIVRSKVNGKPVVNPHTVFKRLYANNIERATLFPDDYVLMGTDKDGEAKSYIGLDRYLSNYSDIDSVTYEVLVGPGPFTISNLTEYATLLARTNSEGKVAYTTNYVTTGAVNPMFTVNYSRKRDIPQVLVTADQLKSTAEISFTVPTDTPATKFWIRLTGGAPEPTCYPAIDGTTIGEKTYTWESGFLIPVAAQGLATIKLADYIGKDMLTVGQDYKIEIALGNDRFGAPGDEDEAAVDWSAPATFKVCEDPAWNGKIAVEVRNAHLAEIAGWDWKKVVVAAYDTPDLVNPVVKASSTNSKFTLSDLRAGQRYYIAAWYVKDVNDGRDQSLRIRQPYDTWGYASMQGESPLCFNAKPIAAVKGEPTAADAVTVYLQDTDWNGNFKIDRLEDFKAVNGLTNPGGGQIVYTDDFDLNGLPDVWEDAQPDEDEEKKIVSDDVMAYYEVPDMTFVALGKDGGETNWIWCAVFDANDPTASYRLTDGTIKKQMPANEIDCLYSTYSYYGTTLSTATSRDPRRWEGIGTNVHYSAEWKVQDIRVGKAKFVHAQVYALFGYEPNACLPGSDYHTKAFTKSDKYLVCRYLQSIGVRGVDESMMLTNIAYQWMWTLKDKVIDSDRDGIADGWELYTMFGPTNYSLKDGVKNFTAESMTNAVNAGIISPFTTEDGMAPAPGSGSQLDLIEEYDNGHFPTDPWSLDTDGDGVLDYYAYNYHLKGIDAREDFDGDGLSNYAEYLISEVFCFAKLDPDNPKTDGACIDYFRKVGDLYLGEVFTDHDQVGDIWEADSLTEHDPYVYNPKDDPDNDGWSNYAEFRVGTDPMRVTTLGVSGADGVIYTKNEYPIPVIEAKVVYNGQDVNLGSVVFKAWSEAVDPDMTEPPDAIWTFGNGDGSEEEGATGPSAETGSTAEPKEKYIGRRPTDVQRYVLGGGSILRGSINIRFLDQSYTRTNIGDNQEEAAGANWYVGVTDKDGVLFDFRGNAVGTVDYDVGVVMLDGSKLTGSAVGLPNSTGAYAATLVADVAKAGNTGGSYYDRISLDNAYVVLAWSVVNVGLSPDGNYTLGDADKATAAAKSHGHVREGLNTFICFTDEDGDGFYTPGEPFGVVRHVDVGWDAARFTMTLTRTTAITPRITLWDPVASDREATVDGFLSTFDMGNTTHKADYGEYPGTNDAQKAANYLAAMAGRIDTSAPPEPGEQTRIRVVRYGIDTLLSYQCGVYLIGPGGAAEQRVVLDKTFNPDGRVFLSEQDFLGDGLLDIDWDTMQTDEIVSASGKPVGGVKMANCDVTNMTYLVVLGDGKKDFRRGTDTNTVRALAQVINRRFEKDRSTPVAQSVGIVHACCPTFTWALPTEDKWASRFGTSYTAFKVQILDAAEDVVYDSGVRRLPAQNPDGSFTWTADACVDDLTALGSLAFARTGNFSWRVSMYNAKFRSDYWSELASFSTAVNAQQGVNDNGYSAVKVAVKYAGPSLVLDRISVTGDPKGKVRVQAFLSADFSGEPVSQACLFDKESAVDLAKLESNVRLIGLPARGTYYIRAYIDMNGNRVLDDWEPWGGAKEPVVLGDQVTEPSLGLFIEDADTDNDLVPDGYEYAKAGWTDDFDDIKDIISSAVDEEGKILFTAEAYFNLTNGLASLSTGLPGASLTLMMNEWFKEMISGKGSVELTADEARALVLKRTKVLENSVRITAFSLDPAKRMAYIYVDGEVETDTAGLALMKKYDLEPNPVEVKVKVYMIGSLAEKWPAEPQWTKPAQIGTDKSCIDVDLSDIDFSSGFFKVEIEQ